MTEKCRKALRELTATVTEKRRLGNGDKSRDDFSKQSIEKIKDITSVDGMSPLTKSE